MHASAFAHEVEEKEGRAVLVRQTALGPEVDLVTGIRKSGVPAGEPGPVVELVIDVPTQDAITEAGPVLEDGAELLEADVLAAVDSVDVGEGKFDTPDAFLLVLIDEAHGKVRMRRAGDGESEQAVIPGEA